MAGHSPSQTGVTAVVPGTLRLPSLLPHQIDQPIPNLGHCIELLRGRLRDCGDRAPLLILAVEQAVADQPKRLNQRRRFPERGLDIEGAVDDPFSEFAGPRAYASLRRTRGARPGIAPG